MSDWDDGYAKGRADERKYQGALFLDASGVGNVLAASIQEAIWADLRAKVESLRDVLERRTALHKGEPYMLPEPVHTYDERTIRAVLDLLDGSSDE